MRTIMFIPIVTRTSTFDHYHRPDITLYFASGIVLLMLIYALAWTGYVFPIYADKYA